MDLDTKSPRGPLLALLLTFASCGPAEAPRNTGPTRASHEVFFSIASGSHAHLDCNSCHGNSDSFREYSCIGCHDHDGPSSDSAHRDITSGYVYSSTSCYQCHPPGTNLLFKHTPFFPIRTGDKHVGIACIGCHTDLNDRTKQDCLSCHPADPVDGQHRDVGGYSRDSALCLSCHADSQVNAVAAHLPFTILAPSKHYLTACSGCHNTQRSDKSFGIDFNVFSCFDCHSQTAIAPTHATLPGYQYDNATCVQSGCHAQGLRSQ